MRLLFEHGRRLDDRERLLEGEGKQTRYLTVAGAALPLGGAIGRYVEGAVAERQFRMYPPAPRHARNPGSA